MNIPIEKAICCDCNKLEEKEKMELAYNNHYTPENELQEFWFVCLECWHKRAEQIIINEEN